MPAIYHEGSWLGNATDPEVLVKDTVGWTGKNRLDFIPHQKSVNNGTITIESDGTVVVNGTFSAQSTARYDTEEGSSGSATAVNASVPNYDCIASFGGNSNVGFTIGYFKSDDTIVDTLKTVRGSQENISFPSDAKKIRCYIVVAAGTYSNAKFYPMLRDASITDPTYEPYHESVEVMYEEEIHGVNLLEVTASTQTINGVTFTVNSDGTIKANGTAGEGNAYLNIITPGANPLSAGTYKASGCPANGNLNTYILFFTNKENTNHYVQDSGNGGTFALNDDIQGMRCTIRIYAGYTANNLVFKPMIRLATIEDPTYRPYNPQAIQNQLNAQGVLGAKNLLENKATSQTINGVTFTVNADKSVTVNGTATANAIFSIISKSMVGSDDVYQKISGKNVIFTSNSNGSSSRVYMSYWDNVIGNLYDYDGNGFDMNLSPTIPSNWNISIVVLNNTTVNNLTFYPMIRLASDPDDTYQPYAMTNRELTEKAAVADVTSQMIAESQTHYTFDSISVVKSGAFALVSGVMNSVDVTSPPVGTSWVVLYANLPHIKSDMFITTPAGRSATANPVQFKYTTDGHLLTRGGTTGDAYYFQLSGILS